LAGITTAETGGVPSPSDGVRLRSWRSSLRPALDPRRALTRRGWLGGGAPDGQKQWRPDTSKERWTPELIHGLTGVPPSFRCWIPKDQNGRVGFPTQFRWHGASGDGKNPAAVVDAVPEMADLREEPSGGLAGHREAGGGSRRCRVPWAPIDFPARRRVCAV